MSDYIGYWSVKWLGIKMEWVEGKTKHWNYWGKPTTLKVLIFARNNFHAIRAEARICAKFNTEIMRSVKVREN